MNDGIRRRRLVYTWDLYHSGYGYVSGWAFTRWGARRKQNRAFAEWLMS